MSQEAERDLPENPDPVFDYMEQDTIVHATISSAPIADLKPLVIRAGVVGDNEVWVGVPEEMYDLLISEDKVEYMHVFRCSLSQAAAVIRLLEQEIARVKEAQGNAAKTALSGS